MVQQGGRVPSHDERREAAEDAASSAGTAGCPSRVWLHGQWPYQRRHQHVLHAAFQRPYSVKIDNLISFTFEALEARNDITWSYLLTYSSVFFVLKQLHINVVIKCISKNN